MSIRSSRANDGKFTVTGVQALAPAQIARAHLAFSSKIVAFAWVRPISFAGTTGGSQNRVFTGHIAPGTTAFAFGFNPDGTAWAGARSTFNSSGGGADTFHSVTSALAINSSSMTMGEWHLIGMHANLAAKKIAVFLDGEWTEADAPDWTGAVLSTSYAPSTGVANEQAYDGLNPFCTTTTKYISAPELHFDGLVSHLWIPRFDVQSPVSVTYFGFRIAGPFYQDIPNLMWRHKLSPRAFFHMLGPFPSYGYWPLESGAKLSGTRYTEVDSLRMTAVGGADLFPDPVLRHVLQPKGIRRIISLPPLPTLSLPTYTPGSLTSSGLSPRVTAT